MHTRANVGWEQVQATLGELKKEKEVDRYLLRVNHPHDRVLAIQASSGVDEIRFNGLIPKAHRGTVMVPT